MVFLALSMAFSLFIAAGSPRSNNEAPLALVHAAFEPGGTANDSYAWRVSISQSGVVQLEVKSSPGWHAPDEWAPGPVRQLSPRKLQALQAAIASARFDELKESYSASYDEDDKTSWIVTDQHTIDISARVERHLKQVKAVSY